MSQFNFSVCILAFLGFWAVCIGWNKDTVHCVTKSELLWNSEKIHFIFSIRVSVRECFFSSVSLFTCGDVSFTPPVEFMQPMWYSAFTSKIVSTLLQIDLDPVKVKGNFRSSQPRFLGSWLSFLNHTLDLWIYICSFFSKTSIGLVFSP